MAKTLAAFDVGDIYREHCYLVSMTKGKSATVQIYEVFGRAPGPMSGSGRPKLSPLRGAPGNLGRDIRGTASRV